MGSEPARMIEWHRADAWPRIRRVLLLGPSILTLGGVVMAASFVVHAPRVVRMGCTLAGLAMVASGALLATLGMQRILRDDTYLALRTDGLFIQEQGRQTLVPWDDVAGAAWDESTGRLVVERLGGHPLAIAARFAGIGGAVLAQRILATKRKVAMNLLGRAEW